MMNTTKTTREDFAAYKRWQKYILSTKPELPKDCKRPTLIAYALAMAIHGTNGLDCFASDTLIGKELGLSNRGTVAKYHKLAVKLGWFVPNGKRRGRSVSLDISIPSESGQECPPATETVVRQTSAPLVPDAEHDRGVSCTVCVPCQTLLQTRDFSEVWEIHSSALQAQSDAWTDAAPF